MNVPGEILLTSPSRGQQSIEGDRGPVFISPIGRKASLFASLLGDFFSAWRVLLPSSSRRFEPLSTVAVATDLGKRSVHY